ncbi:hypothetical protein [Thiohalocapsa sp. ML1]|uniref:hypothetical protein n=1 Tax=Thiohalocapsa sp. ML1 TaxID=1431688 RepID=UPI0012E36320|nr:hypothetical protein [Thiohalocapsa sp. ML1]
MPGFLAHAGGQRWRFLSGDARAGSLLMLIACVILRLDERLVKAGQQLGIAAVCLRSETSTDNDG